MTDQMLIAPSVILSEAKDLLAYALSAARSFADSAAQDDRQPRRRRFVTPFLVVEFATELDEPFVYATMEVASE